MLHVFLLSLLLNTVLGDAAHHAGVHVVSWKFDYVKAELILALFIVLIGCFKLRK